MNKKIMTRVVMLVLMIVSLIFTIQGVNMHAKVPSEEAKFHNLNAQYFSLDKTTRDSAPAGSELNNQLVELHNYPSSLMELKLIGVGKILTGIFVLLFGILIALMIMPMKLGAVIKENK